MDRSICYSDIINTYCEGKWKERNRGIFYLPGIANIAESNFAFHNKTWRSSLSVATYCNNARDSIFRVYDEVYHANLNTQTQTVNPLRIELTKQSYSRNCPSGVFFPRVYISCKHCSLLCAPSLPVVQVTRVCVLRKSTRSKPRLSCFDRRIEFFLIFISKEGFIFIINEVAQILQRTIFNEGKVDED